MEKKGVFLSGFLLNVFVFVFGKYFSVHFFQSFASSLSFLFIYLFFSFLKYDIGVRHRPCIDRSRSSFCIGSIMCIGTKSMHVIHIGCTVGHRTFDGIISCWDSINHP